MICKHIWLITFLNEPDLDEPEFFFVHSQMVSSIAIQHSQFNISHL